MKTHSWGTKIVKKDGNEMTRNFQIQIPVLAAVGRYVIITELIISMTKLLDADWLRRVQLFH
jgi:hypothetical protein